mmetsp:Transcript_92475/g.135170  ORF Transcript_92475/g.135170 Transcript_92475/m.135170 type:complete len:241 (-) Transcript_92475:795-1517(-)
MRKYLQMLMTHAVMPAAAPDLPRMVSTLKCALLMQFVSTHVHALSGVLSLSNEISTLRNWSTLAIIFLAPFQLISLGFLPPLVSQITAAVTSSTPAGGLARDFNSVIDFLSRVPNAASASRMMGSAASRSLSHSFWNAITSSAIAEHLASSTAAPAFCSSAIAVSLPTTTISSSVASFLASTIIISLTRFSCSSATCSAALFIFSNPFSSRSFRTRISDFLLSSIRLYKEIKSRKLLGVV